MRKVIAFEGIDGSGKTVQVSMLKSFLSDGNYKVAYKEFPVYNSFFGKMIGSFLSGKTDVNAGSIDPMSMALWFAMDRKADFERDDPDSDILLINRYVLSNAAYQSARCSDTTQKKPDEMIDWVMELEHNVLGLPEPDIYVFFNVSKNQADKNVQGKGYRNYIGDGKDVYEASDNMQNGAQKAYFECANRFKNVEVIECMSDGEFLSAEEIHRMVIEVLVKNNVIDRR